VWEITRAEQVTGTAARLGIPAVERDPPVVMVGSSWTGRGAATAVTSCGHGEDGQRPVSTAQTGPGRLRRYQAASPSNEIRSVACSAARWYPSGLGGYRGVMWAVSPTGRMVSPRVRWAGPCESERRTRRQTAESARVASMVANRSPIDDAGDDEVGIVEGGAVGVDEWHGHGLLVGVCRGVRRDVRSSRRRLVRRRQVRGASARAVHRIGLRSLR
jgi:hypothetical protein